MKNNIRFDLSDYLIHFRDVNLETGSHIYLPEHCGFNNQHHACFIDAKYLLRDYLYAVIKSRPGHTEMGNEPYMVTPGGMFAVICRLQLFRTGVRRDCNEMKRQRFICNRFT